MTCLLKHEWPTLTAALLNLALTLILILLHAPGANTAINAALAGFLLAAAIWGHMLWHAREDSVKLAKTLDEVAHTRMTALAEAFALQPIEDRLRRPGDRVLITCKGGGGVKRLDVEAFPAIEDEP